MWEYIAEVIWFFFPAGIANMAASLSRFVPVLDRPVDFGATWRGKRIFGSHKTWRGIIFGSAAGVIFFYTQKLLYQFDTVSEISILNYSEASWLIGLLLGFGAVAGDAIRSFFKRRVNIEPGGPWIPFDQIDYSLGAGLLVSIIFFPGWDRIAAAVSLGLVLHILTNVSAYVIGLQKNKL